MIKTSVIEKPFITYKEEFIDDDFSVEYEILPAYNKKTYENIRRNKISEKINYIELLQKELDEKISTLNVDIEKLTNHADGFDYAVAVVSGLIAGMMDVFFVKETEIDQSKVQEFLEGKYHTANDSGYKHRTNKNPDNWIDSAMYHRLDDLAHHPTIGGLVASILVRFFRLVIFIDGTDGKPHFFFADTSSPKETKRELKDLLKAWIGAVISGVCLWLAHVAEKKYKEINQEEMPAPLKAIVKTIAAMPMIIELLKAVDVWVGHMMSDVSTPQGIPGIFLSLMKELSVLPFLRDTNFRVHVDSLYRKGENNLNEWGGVIFTAAKKQSIPILINETITRSFYFIRHLILEYKEHGNWKDVNWANVVPFRNRTIVRMLTISSGTFTAIDLADAAIKSAIKNGPPTNSLFWKDFVLRVNFVGIGRFVIAIGSDVGMGIKRQKLIKERMQYKAEWNMLNVSKIYYLQEDMWIEVTDTEKAIDDMCQTAEKSMLYFVESWNDISNNLEKIQKVDIVHVEEKNPGLVDDLKDILEWG